MRTRPPSSAASAAAVRDAGFITAVEMLSLLVFGLVALLFLGYLGRLHAAAIQIENTSQAAARAASLASDRSAAASAVESAIALSAIDARCGGAADASLTWSPSPTGSWQGGSVTVTIRCTIPNDELAGIWTPGDRTISASDTQPIDRYQR